jgi:hypothetical protein
MALINADSLVQGERSLNTIRIGAAGILLVGSVILGIVVHRTRVLTWLCGVLLIIAFPLGDVANALFSGAEGILPAGIRVRIQPRPMVCRRFGSVSTRVRAIAAASGVPLGPS